MFEPQDHPNDFAYPGGPPKRPYDNAGYTLAYQMGVQFDRILDGFDVSGLTEVQGLAAVPPAKIATTSGAGYLVSHEMNNAFLAVNKALKGGADVYLLKAPMKAGSTTYPAGTFWIASNRTTTTMMQDLARTQGVAYEATSSRPSGDAQKLRQMRVGLVDQYGGSMPSGWTRLHLRAVRLPVQRRLSEGARRRQPRREVRRARLPVGHHSGVSRSGVRRARRRRLRRRRDGHALDPRGVPPLARPRHGRQARFRRSSSFLEAGGTVVAVGSSANLGYHLGLPMENALTENGGRDLPADKYYIPGSVLRVAVDTTKAVSYGVGTNGMVDVFFDNSPAFKLGADAAAKGVRPLAWFDTKTPLRSGWAWGQTYLDGAVQAAEAKVGQGNALPVRAGDHVPGAAVWNVQVAVQRHLLGAAGGTHGDVTSCGAGVRRDDERPAPMWSGPFAHRPAIVSLVAAPALGDPNGRCARGRRSMSALRGQRTAASRDVRGVAPRVRH